MSGFDWNITSVFFRLIVSSNRRAAFAKESVVLFISLIECAMSAQSSANSRSRTSSSVVLVRITSTNVSGQPTFANSFQSPVLLIE